MRRCAIPSRSPESSRCRLTCRLQALLANELAEANRQTPILMCHGQFDPVLPLALGVMACNWLRSSGYKVEWKEYPMQHQVCQPEIQDIAAWLRARLPAEPAR